MIGCEERGTVSRVGDGGACHHQMGWAGGQVCLGRVGKRCLRLTLSDLAC